MTTTGVRSAETTTVIGCLARRNVTERRRFIAGLSVSMVTFALMVGALYPSIGAMYDEMLDELPAALDGLLGGADFSTPEGFMHVELFSFLAPSLAIAAAISLGAGSLAGAEQNGRLALVLACPISRSDIVSGALLAVVVAAGVVTGALFVAISGAAAIGDLDLSLSNTASACLSVMLLALALGAIAVAIGARVGKRGVAVAVTAGIAVASYAVNAFFPLNSTLEPFSGVSLWHLYGDNQPMVNGLDVSDSVALLLITVIASGFAYRWFERRDLCC